MRRPTGISFGHEALIRERGFTLLEVLVALAVLALALMAALRASAVGTQNAAEIRLRQLADWVAEDRLAEHRGRRDWLPIGGGNGEVEQGGSHFRWEENVSGTPNAQFRRIEIRVRAAEQPDGAILAHITGFLVRPGG